jgi:hypothetical protein
MYLLEFIYARSNINKAQIDGGGQCIENRFQMHTNLSAGKGSVPYDHQDGLKRCNVTRIFATPLAQPLLSAAGREKIVFPHRGPFAPAVAVNTHPYVARATNCHTASVLRDVCRCYLLPFYLGRTVHWEENICIQAPKGS